MVSSVVSTQPGHHNFGEGMKAEREKRGSKVGSQTEQKNRGPGRGERGNEAKKEGRKNGVGAEERGV